MKTKDYLKPTTSMILVHTEQLFCFSTTSTAEDFVIEDDETNDLF